MKVAVISDIHANLIALQEVLKDMVDEGCEKDICLGDVVLAGPQPKETIEFFKQQDWLVIQGNTDKLIVDFGSEVLQIVCGAPNVRKGLKVIVALDGAVLPGDFKIKKSMKRGVESCGMLCSLAELGLDNKFLTEVDKEGIHELPLEAKVGEEITITIPMFGWEHSLTLSAWDNNGNCIYKNKSSEDLLKKYQNIVSKGLDK